MADIALTAEEIAKHYNSALHSVNLINKLAALDSLTDEEMDTLDRNVRHLEIILGHPYWTSEDLSPFSDAVAVGRGVLG